MNVYAPTALTRACEATQIPSGQKILLPAGARVRVTQSLGGNYTLLTEEGELVLLSGKDRGALGEGAEEAAPAPAGNSPFDQLDVWDQLKTVYDPEIPVNIVDLGLVYQCKLKELPDGGRKVEIEMTMTAPGCGMGQVLKQEVEQKLLGVPGISEVSVEIVWEPPWDPSRMSEAAQLQLGWI